MTGQAITLRDLTVTYGRTPAIRSVNGRFAPGSLTAIVGPNGAGKSTLLRTIAGNLKPDQGTVDRSGLPIGDIGVLPQAAELDRSFPFTVADTVLLGAWRHVGALRGVDHETAKKARAALTTVGLAGLELRRVEALSAGQFQRVLFARLLLQDASVILLDEPFTAIDEQTTEDLMRLVRQWHQEKRTVIAVLHDFEQVHAAFPEVLLLDRKVIAWGATRNVLTPENLHRIRTGNSLEPDRTRADEPNLERC